MARTSYFTGFPLNENQTVYVENILQQLEQDALHVDERASEALAYRNQAQEAATGAQAAESIAVSARDDAIQAQNTAGNSADVAVDAQVRAESALETAASTLVEVGEALDTANNALTLVNEIQGTIEGSVEAAETAAQEADLTKQDIANLTSSFTGSYTLYRYTAVGAETDLGGPDDNANILSYTPGSVSLFKNGQKLVDGVDYAAVDGETISDLTALDSGDVVEIQAFNLFSVIDATRRSRNLADLPNVAEARANLGAFSTIADVQNSHIPAVLESVGTLGFSEAGVGGSSLRRKPQGAPALPGDVTSADGARWEISDTEISIVQLGALADGDGSGGGTPIDTALQDAINLLAHRGGGVVKIPYSGAGIYRLDGLINGAAEVEIQIDPGVKLDVTHGGRFEWNGSIESEINLGANATKGDTTITTAAPHGLEVGDWFLLKSQRLAMNPVDAGDYWLGFSTGGTTGVYFAEPCQVAEVTSSTEVVVASPLIFPDYRTDASQETDPNARPSSTIAKINWLERPRFVGGSFINIPHQNVLRFEWCFQPYVEGPRFDFGTGTRRGHSVRMHSCYELQVHRPCTTRPGDTVVEPNHSQFNSYMEVGCWHSVWSFISDSNGSQCYDVSWANLGHPSINFCVRNMLSMGNKLHGFTSHSGAWGGTVETPRLFNCYNGVSNRSRNVAIINPQIIGGRVGAGTSGIHVFPSGRGTRVLGGFVSGYDYGLRSNDTELGNKSRDRDLLVEGTVFSHCRRGIWVNTANPERESAELSGIIISRARFFQIAQDGVLVDPYANGVMMLGNVFGPFSAAGAFGIRIATNAVLCQMFGNRGINMGASATLIEHGNNPNDATTFPAAEYPNSLHTLGDNSVVGPGTLISAVSSRIGTEHKVGAKGHAGVNADMPAEDMHVVENNGSLYQSYISSDAGNIRLSFGNRSSYSRGGLVYQNSNDWLRFRAGDDYRWNIDTDGHFIPQTDDTYNVGRTNWRLANIFAASGTVNTSDSREKTPLRQLDATEVAVAIRLSKLPGVYQWLSAIDRKGADARLHMGVLAQDVRAAFEAEGLDGYRYGVLCWDEWGATDPVYDDEGNEVSPAREAGDRYGIRYDELAQWQAAGWNARLEALEGVL